MQISIIRTRVHTPETVSEARASAVQLSSKTHYYRKGCEGRFFWSSLFLLGFCPEIGLAGNLWARSVTQKSVGPVATHPTHQQIGPKYGKVEYWKCWVQMCWSRFWPTFEMTNPDVAPRNCLFSQNVQFGCSIPGWVLFSNVKCRCSAARCRESEMLNAVADQG